MADTEPSSSQWRAWAERLVTLLDDRFRIPGTEVRFGLDPVIGVLLPGFGDAITGTSSIGLLALAVRRGVPRIVLWRMVLNVLADVLLGSLPLIGDVFDVAFKANRRNLELIRAHESPDSKASGWDYVVVAFGISLAIAGIVAPLVVMLYLGVNYGPELLDQLRLR